MKPRMFRRMGHWFLEVEDGISLCFAGTTPREAWSNYQKNWVAFK